MQGLTISAKCK